MRRGGSPFVTHVLSCLLIIRSETSPESRFKAKVVAITRDVCELPLLVTCDEGQLVRHAIFECEDLILVLRKICRVRHAQVVVDLSPDRQPRRRAICLSGDERVDLKNI